MKRILVSGIRPDYKTINFGRIHAWSTITDTSDGGTEYRALCDCRSIENKLLVFVLLGKMHNNQGVYLFFFTPWNGQ